MVMCYVLDIYNYFMYYNKNKQVFNLSVKNAWIVFWKGISDESGWLGISLSLFLLHTIHLMLIWWNLCRTSPFTLVQDSCFEELLSWTTKVYQYSIQCKGGGIWLLSLLSTGFVIGLLFGSIMSGTISDA